MAESNAGDRKPRTIITDTSPVKGYRGEPWRIEGRNICDRNGDAFAEVLAGGENLARTAIMCVNLLAGYPLREGDGEPTQLQELAMLTLLDQARELSGD